MLEVRSRQAARTAERWSMGTSEKRDQAEDEALGGAAGVAAMGMDMFAVRKRGQKPNFW